MRPSSPPDKNVAPSLRGAPPNMPRAHIAQKLALALAAPLFVLGVFESALWLAAFRYRPAEAPILIWNPVEDRALENQQGLFQSDDRTLWSPRPGATIPWGKDERVNSEGFRGPVLARERRPGVTRIATLGDSSTFGMGVAYADTYGAQLERILSADGNETEVLNAGVVGFTIRQGLERYRRDVRPYRPDVVIAAFGAVNEHHMAIGLPDDVKIARSTKEFSSTERAWYWAKANVHVFQFISYAGFTLGGGVDGQRERSKARQRREFDLSHSAGQTSWDGTRRVTTARYAELIGELAREVEKDGARLVVLVMPRESSVERNLPILLEYTDLSREAGARAGAAVCDGRAAFQAEEARGVDPKSLFVPGDAWHPNAVGHGVLARELAPLVRAAIE